MAQVRMNNEKNIGPENQSQPNEFVFFQPCLVRLPTFLIKMAPCKYSAIGRHNNPIKIMLVNSDIEGSEPLFIDGINKYLGVSYFIYKESIAHLQKKCNKPHFILCFDQSVESIVETYSSIISISKYSIATANLAYEYRDGTLMMNDPQFIMDNGIHISENFMQTTRNNAKSISANLLVKISDLMQNELYAEQKIPRSCSIL
jgi:hypothetical protein